MSTFFLAVIDGFGRLVELAPGSPEIDPRVNQNEFSDWLQVGDDLRLAISEHPDLNERNRLDKTAEELVEA